MRVAKMLIFPAFLLVGIGAYGLYLSFSKYVPDKGFLNQGERIKGLFTQSKSPDFSQIIAYPGASVVSQDKKGETEIYVFESKDTPFEISKYFLGEAQKKGYKIEGPLNFVKDGKRLKVALTANETSSSVIIEVSLLPL